MHSHYYGVGSMTNTTQFDSNIR